MVEKWVESCKGYELMLEKQIKSYVKFGNGFRKNDQVSVNIVVNESGFVEVIQTNLVDQEIKVPNKNGKKIVFIGACFCRLRLVSSLVLNMLDQGT
ncbi:hypothetical protein Hanom_Chr16g01427661 [Helianthus anomalus]